jgi:hypothetical protein
MSDASPKGLSEKDWRLLLHRIQQGRCTPFIGAGACHGVLPLGKEIAQQWAVTYGYPLQDAGDLPRVAQYLAIENDPMFPKEEVLQAFIEPAKPPNFAEPDEPHAVLADLPLPIYMTTNYDDFMVQALESRSRKPRQVYCEWSQLLRDEYPSGLDKDFTPSKGEPVVFHLHGHKALPESLVLTEDDYLDFLVNVTRDQGLLPHQIRKALAGTTLLFTGYSLADWDFRVLFRGLVTSTEDSLRRLSITVQLPPMPDDATDAERRRMRNYQDKYFGTKGMQVYWGTAREFAADLRKRWQEYKDGR